MRYGVFGESRAGAGNRSKGRSEGKFASEEASGVEMDGMD